MDYCGQLRPDMNGDGIVTISDFPLQIGHILRWPWRKLIELLAAEPQTAVYFELSPHSCYGTLAWLGSMAAYFLAVVAIINVIGYLLSIVDHVRRGWSDGG